MHVIKYFFPIADNIAVMKKINRNIYKPHVSEHVKDILRKNFTHEIEFYEFCKQRLHMQYAALIQAEQLQLQPESWFMIPETKPVRPEIVIVIWTSSFLIVTLT